MAALKVVFTVLFLIVCVAIIVLVLLQEGNQGGLGSTISGGSDSFWAKNKSRSVEGKLENYTRILAIVFFVIAVLLNVLN